MLVALRGEMEMVLVSALERADGLTVVRRCADMAELLATALAGLGIVAVLDADLEPERSVIARLARAGLRTVVVCPPSESDRYRSMGAEPVGYDLSIDGIVAEIGRLATQELVLDPGLPSPDEESVASAPPGAMVAVWGAPGSPGRSTIAINLAAEIAATSQQTMLIDADVWGAALASSLGLMQESAGLAAAVRTADRGTLDSGSLARLCIQVSDNLVLLPGLSSSGRWREVSGVGLDDVWQQARLLAEWVVVDTPILVPDDDSAGFDAMGPQRNAVMASALANAEHTVVVGAAEPLGIQRLVQTIVDSDERQDIVGRRHIVVNRLRSSAAGPRAIDSVGQALHRFAGVGRAHVIADDRPACDRAALAGAYLADLAPHSPARESIRELARDIIGVPARRRVRRRWRG